MIKLFLGPDNFSKKQAILDLASKLQAEIVRISPGDTVPLLDELGCALLFGPSRMFVFERSFLASSLPEQLEQAIASPALLVVAEDQLDKRTQLAGKLLKHPNIEVQEFALPQGAKLEQWVKNQAAARNAKITPSGLRALLDALVVQPTSSWGEPKLDLHQIDSELQKLAAFAAGQPIDEAMVASMVPKSIDTEVWQVVNAIADKNPKATLAALADFFSASDGADEKAKVIQLTALLAEQFRNILMTQDFQSRGVGDAEILKATGWKSGRLFIMKKTSAKFGQRQIKEALAKLESLDIELKTSSVPPLPILNLILVQLLYK